MEHYNEIRKKAFTLSHEALMKSMDDRELLRAVARLKADPSFSFGLIRGLKQRQIGQWHRLVVEGKWNVKESYYCHEESMRRYQAYTPSDTPRFVLPESYKAWQELRAKYPKGFDFYPGGREAWREYEDKYPDFWAESRLFDGRAHFRFGKVCYAPKKIFHKEQGGYGYSEHAPIAEDELFLILDVEADANTQKEEYKDTPGICFVLTPNLESFEERRMALLNQFKAHVLTNYLRKVMKHYDDCYAEKYKEEILEISDMVMAGAFDMEKEKTEDE